jgi:hypothetical protein
MPDDICEWGIYHRDREYARECGDPLLGTVLAGSKEQAEAKAIAGEWHKPPRGMLIATSGLWAVPCREAARPL